MEEEISFHEFSDFYKKVIDELNSNHESYDEEAVWKVLFIVENVMSNADGRVKESKGSESKKYQKKWLNVSSFGRKTLLLASKRQAIRKRILLSGLIKC